MMLSGDMQFYLKMHHRLVWRLGSDLTRWGSLQRPLETEGGVVVVVIA